LPMGFRSEVNKELLLLENVIKCLLKFGKVSIMDIREKTIYMFDSNEISWALKRLRKIGLVTYDSRVWYLNENMIKGLGLLAFKEILNFALKNGS
jgi:coproporphyrinogen III oxidase-like Fe-S oxidoreductase